MSLPKSPGDRLREQNRLSNVYKREADGYQIGSPSRISEYIQHRLKGKTPEQAIALVRNKK